MKIKSFRAKANIIANIAGRKSTLDVANNIPAKSVKNGTPE